MPEFTRAEYTNPTYGVFQVERVQPDDITQELAEDVLRLLATTYSAQLESKRTDLLEEKPPLLSRGTIDYHFRPFDEENIDQYEARMRQYTVKHQSQYWLLRLPPEEADALPVTGLVKVSPSKNTLKQKLGKQPPNAYINDIFVQPEQRGHGFGSALVHATFTQDFEPTVTAALDVFYGNDEANGWFERIGFSPSHSIGPFRFNNREVLQQIRYTTGDKTVGDVVEELERWKPWLGEVEFG